MLVAQSEIITQGINLLVFLSTSIMAKFMGGLMQAIQ